MKPLTKVFDPSRRKILGGMAALGAGSLLGCAGRPRASYDVVIIGAGLSGLYAASLLEAAGVEAVVLEARDRTGGRVRTLRDLPDQPDVGGTQIGSSYGNFRALAQLHGIEIGTDPAGAAFRRGSKDPRAGLVLNIRGQLIRAEDWAGSEVNSLPDSERQTPPYSMLYAMLAPLNPYQTYQDWCDPKFAHLDQSIGETLTAAGASEEALRLIDVNADNHGIADASVARVWRSLVLIKGQRSEQVLGGTALVTDAMTRALKSPIFRNTPVTRIQESGDRIMVDAADGRRFNAGSCICTAPLPALRNIQLDVALGDVTRQAVAETPYVPITQVFVDALSPFWEDDELPVTMWTDSGIERLFNRIDDQGRVIGYRAWINGAGALAADRMPEPEFARYVESEIGRLRPAAAGKVRFVRRYSWTREPYSGGAYVSWPAGKTALFANAVRQPGQRIFFAGEHTALNHSGLEGALESGARAAGELLSRLS